MPKRIYVGNLPFSATDDEVRSLVGSYVKSSSVRVEKGVAVVELASEGDVRKALAGLQKARLGGRALTVSEARPRS